LVPNEIHSERSGRKRFDIVIFNYKRLETWFRNIHRFRGLDPATDRITVVSCSPSPEELALVRAFEAERGFDIRYLTRGNRGLGELARIDYFTGEVGNLSENLAYEFIFQMQDHYLDTDSACSHWGPELNYRVKGDVVPDNTVFDLPSLHEKLVAEDLSGGFCDRNNPCWFTLGRRRYVAPNGGNFIIRSSDVRNTRVYRLCKALRKVCDNSHPWAVYAEFMWGVAFFEEGRRFYDIKRDRIFSAWDPHEFYFAPDNVAQLHNYYGPGIASGFRRRRALIQRVRTFVLGRVRTALKRVRDSAKTVRSEPPTR